MRNNISDGGHDPRFVDLVAVLALLILVIAGIQMLHGQSPSQTALAFVEPSQTVHW